MSEVVEAVPLGLHAGVPEAVYHADRGSLSQSGAKLLLPPSTPAKFRYRIDNPPAPKRQFDFGHAAHKFVLGEGEEIVPVYAEDWRTKGAKEQRDSAHAEGKIPLLSSEIERAMEMAAVVAAHPLAGPIFTEGRPEMSMCAIEPDTGVLLRGRADWLGSGRVLDLGDRLLIADYKTAVDADPRTWGRKALDYGYHLQFAWYITLARLLDLDDSPIFLNVCQEKEPPYLVSVNELDAEFYQLGREQMQLAIAIYADCCERDEWPGYPAEIHPVSPPPWAFRPSFNDTADN